MAGKRKTSNEWEAGNSLKKRKTDGSEREALRCNVMIPGPADNTNQLQINDLAEVLQLLRRYGYSGISYYTLGLYLGLSPVTLAVIKENNKGNVENCLHESLTKWLQKADNVQKTKGGPTIYSLISALRELGENGVADGIDMEKHPACKILACHSVEQSLLPVIALPQLVILLQAAKLINEMILPTNIQGEALLIQIKEAVCDNYHRLQAFAKILCQITPTIEIGCTIIKEYKKIFCSKDSLMTNGDNELKIYLPQSMIAEFKTMRLKFGETFSSVKDIMKENPPALEKIRDTLNFSYPALKPQLDQCQDIHSILELISENCSLNDISMLEFFVTQSKIDELVQIIQEYNEAIKKFSETKLSRYLKGKFSNASPLHCERITIVVDRNTDECTLNDVRRLSANTFQDLSQHVRLNVISDGDSFTITCSFPLILSEQLITAALNNIDVLKENKVKRLTIGYCTVYEVTEIDNTSAIEMCTSEDQCTSSFSSKSGISEQLMLSLSVQLINSNEEMNTLKGKSEKKMEQLQKKLSQKEVELEDMQQEQAKSKKEIESLQKKIIKQYEKLNENESKLQASLQEPLIFQDDIYGGITIDHPLIVKIVQTHQFQRLRDIKILGYTYQNIPKANYSRLQHSIGMYYLAGEYVKQLQRRQPELNITESDVLCVQIAALCYNLGHGPFSHIFDMFLDEICTRDKSDKPWKNVFEASVKMFQYMLEDNEDLMAIFEKYFVDPMKDIAFIKELIQGTGYEQRKDKKFLHKIIFNKKSGLDVSMIDSTVRDATVLGKSLTFQWKEFLNKVRVLECDGGELHKCFLKDDLDACNALFRTRNGLFRELYYSHKSRMAALMIRRILVKSNEIPIFKDDFSRRVTLFEATKSMSAYSQLNDSILDVIKLYVDDPEVQVLLKCLNTTKVIGQIGSVTPTYHWNEYKIKQHIVRSIKSPDITDQLILDPIKTGYENWTALTQYYYTSDRKTGQWTEEWAKPPRFAATQLRIFLVSGDRALIREVQKTVQQLITDEQLIPGEIYPDEENYNLMPQIPSHKKEGATELKGDVASALAKV